MNNSRIIHKKFAPEQVAITFDRVNFGYIENKPIIKNLSFQIQKGEYVCVIGHNGSGKSTISKLLMGLVKPWDGRVVVNQKVMSFETLKEILNKMGLIFQNPDNQFIGLTTRDDIAFGLENRKVPPGVMEEIIEAVAQVIGITPLLDKQPEALSGGEKQKVAITSILAIDPDIIIFDEATAMLDPKSKLEVKQLMSGLARNQHKTVLSISHDMEEIALCDRVLIMRQGELVGLCSPKLIFNDPQFLLDTKLNLPFNVALSHQLQQLHHDVSNTNDLDLLVQQLVAQLTQSKE